MSAYNKVVWSEGLLLRPQHFQQQDRYFERYIDNRCAALRGHGWGLLELEIERDLLAVGKVALRRVAGIFADGTPFRLPDDGPLPPPIAIDPLVRDQHIFLAVPLRRIGGLESDRGQVIEAGVRHGVREVEMQDATSRAGAPEVVEVATLSTRLVAGSAALDDCTCIPVAYVLECRADQQVVLDDRFIPTVLDVRASARLVTFMNELQALLHQRGESLAQRLNALGRGSAPEVMDVLMLQTVNRYEPVLAHLIEIGLVHPEEFYRMCVAAIGDLATFTASSKRPPPMLGYRHDRLRESFEPVFATLRGALSSVVEQVAIPIPLEPKKFGISVAALTDRSLLESAVFVLGARADLPTQQLRRRFPGQLKVGPVEKIRDLVNMQLPGIPILTLPVAPEEIPRNAGFVYFELDQSSELWQQLNESGGIAVHVSGEFPGLQLEFWAIRS
jgi:type VI secretion system protein ImpJ